MLYRKKRGAIQARLPMIPSRARFPYQSSGPPSKLPRKIPRRIKGKFRRIVAGRGEDEEVDAGVHDKGEVSFAHHHLQRISLVAWQMTQSVDLESVQAK